MKKIKVLKDVNIEKDALGSLHTQLNQQKMKSLLDSTGPGFCLAKWTQVTMHLGSGLTHSCHHPGAHKIPLDELKERKATEEAKNRMIKIHLKENRTLHHDIVGKFGAGKIILRSAAPGTGIIAGGPMRALFESLGIKDVVAKSIGSSNAINVAKAALDGLLQLKDLKEEEKIRGKKLPVYFEE